MTLARKSIDNIISASPMRSIFPAAKAPKFNAKTLASKSGKKTQPSQKKEPVAKTTISKSKAPVKKAPSKPKKTPNPAKKKAERKPGTKSKQFEDKFIPGGIDWANMPPVDLTGFDK